MLSQMVWRMDDRRPHMSVNDMIGYIITALSFFSMILSALSLEQQPLAYVLIIFAFALSGAMLCYLIFKQNREYTLYVLSMENRSLSLRLLLTYNWLLQTKNQYVERFSASKLHMSKARYEFEFRRSGEKGNNLYDMRCQYTFTVKGAWASQYDFDILIMQPKGNEMRSIQYAFGEYGHVYDAGTEPIRLSGSRKKLPALWKARISFNGNKDIDRLIVSYTMPSVDRIDEKHLGNTIIVCPFIYARKVDCVEFIVRYPKEVTYRPNAICLKKYPYDGKKYAPQKLLSFEADDSALVWRACPKTCSAQAIYVIEMHEPVENRLSGDL